MNNTQITKEKMSKNKVLLIIVCIFVALVLIFGTTFGIIIAVRNAKTLFSYGGVYLDRGEAAFLAASYKYKFLVANASDGAVDTPEFWYSKYDDSTTYAELLEKGTENYIKETVIKCYLFDRFCTYERSDEDTVKLTAGEILDYRADGSEEKFNEIYADFGFNFEDFESCAEILYKAETVGERIYGVDGANMKSFSDECTEFFGNYSHVKLLFIRTEDKFLLDSDGNRIVDESTGEDMRVALTDTEKAERQALLTEIRASIEAYDNQTDDLRMTAEYFNNLLTNHGEGDPDMNGSGYYFYAGSAYTAEFAGASDALLEIVKKSLSMDKNTYAETEYSGGVCFIYKYENTAGAYTDTKEGGFFSDFYSLAADATFADAVEELTRNVKVSEEKYSEIDVVAIPSKNMFIPRF